MAVRIDFDLPWRTRLFQQIEAATFLAYDPATDAVATTGAAVDAIFLEERHHPQPAPDGGEAAVVGRQVLVRARSLGSAGVTRRGVIARRDGTFWAVESAALRTFGTRWVCETHKVPAAV